MWYNINTVDNEKDDIMNRPTRFYSSRQEKAVAKALGGKKTPNSGATPWVKGDVVADDWLVECKTSTAPKSSFSIKKEWLEKNREEAFATGKAHNTLCFDFGDGGDRYYILDEKTFKEAKELWTTHKSES